MIRSAWDATRRGLSAACTRLAPRGTPVAASADTFELAQAAQAAARGAMAPPAGALRAPVTPLQTAEGVSAVAARPLDLLRTDPEAADLLISATYDAAYNCAWLRQAYGEERFTGFAAVYPDLPLIAAAPFSAERIVAMLRKLPPVQVLRDADDLSDALASADYHMDVLLTWVFAGHTGLCSVTEEARLRHIDARFFTVPGAAAPSQAAQTVPLQFYTAPLRCLSAILKGRRRETELCSEAALLDKVPMQILGVMNKPWPHSAVKHPRLAFACDGDGDGPRYVLLFSV
ncbi:MAG TPA: hypothetical protein VFH51_19580 [Myxococcota bacterium]|nr:hypothetical protein [Myxococcota bacterium]